MIKKVIPDLVAKYIRGTEKEAIVPHARELICKLTFTVTKQLNCESDRVYVNTRALKHIYDKRPAEEFDFLIESIHKLIKYPSQVYLNKQAKRGNFIFVKEIQGKKYFCSVELTQDGEKNNHFEVVTFFRVQKESYLANYDLLWEWEGRQPSS